VGTILTFIGFLLHLHERDRDWRYDHVPTVVSFFLILLAAFFTFVLLQHLLLFYMAWLLLLAVLAVGVLPGLDTLYLFLSDRPFPVGMLDYIRGILFGVAVGLVFLAFV
jgi:hypothetical protein